MVEAGLRFKPLSVAGRGTPSRAWNWALVWHSEMNCPRRHMCWQSKRFYWERAPGWRAGGKGTQENCSAPWLTVSGFMVMGLVVFSQSFWLRVLSGGACLAQPRWMTARRILGGGQTCGVSFWPFLNSSCWWWLISSVFLTRTSCHKRAHANADCGAWPEWTVSVSLLPLTPLALKPLHCCTGSSLGDKCSGEVEDRAAHLWWIGF